MPLPDDHQPTPVVPDLLTPEQATGRECVFCGRPILPGPDRRHVGFYGWPVWKLYACASESCQHKRLPTYPQFGSV